MSGLAAFGAWFLGTRVGRWLLAAGALLLAVWAALAAAKREGARAAKAEMRERREQAAQKRQEVEHEVDSLDRGDLGVELSEWVRHDRDR